MTETHCFPLPPALWAWPHREKFPGSGAKVGDEPQLLGRGVLRHLRSLWYLRKGQLLKHRAPQALKELSRLLPQKPLTQRDISLWLTLHICLKTDVRLTGLNGPLDISTTWRNDQWPWNNVRQQGDNAEDLWAHGKIQVFRDPCSKLLLKAGWQRGEPEPIKPSLDYFQWGKKFLRFCGQSVPTVTCSNEDFFFPFIPDRAVLEESCPCLLLFCHCASSWRKNPSSPQLPLKYWKTQ